MTYFDATRMKKILTEKGQVEDSKIEMYGLLADNHINIRLINLQAEPIIPIPAAQITAVLQDLATALGCAYFYKFESGDTITAEEAETQVETYMTNKYRRPRFVISTGPLGGAPIGINYDSQNQFGV